MRGILKREVAVALLTGGQQSHHLGKATFGGIDIIQSRAIAIRNQ